MKISIFFLSLLAFSAPLFSETFPANEPLKRGLHFKESHHPTLYQALTLIRERKAKVLIETQNHSSKEEAGSVLFSSFAKGSNALFFIICQDPTSAHSTQDALCNFVPRWAENTQLIQCDSIPFLNEFEKPIDLLHINSKNSCSNQQLLEIYTAYPLLHPKSIVLVDLLETVPANENLAATFLVEKGWEILSTDSHALLVFPTRNKFFPP